MFIVSFYGYDIDWQLLSLLKFWHEIGKRLYMKFEKSEIRWVFIELRINLKETFELLQLVLVRLYNFDQFIKSSDMISCMNSWWDWECSKYDHIGYFNYKVEFDGLYEVFDASCLRVNSCSFITDILIWNGGGSINERLSRKLIINTSIRYIFITYPILNIEAIGEWLSRDHAPTELLSFGKDFCTRVFETQFLDYSMRGSSAYAFDESINKE